MYGKEEATLMGSIWNLQKKKLGEIKNTSDAWWSDTIAEFNAIASEAKNEDSKTCLSYHAIAALRDLEAKATGKKGDFELHYIGGMTAEQFIDYLKDAQSGDLIRIGDKRIEIR